jgi:hypothetical protein
VAGAGREARRLVRYTLPRELSQASDVLTEQVRALPSYIFCVSRGWGRILLGLRGFHDPSFVSSAPDGACTSVGDLPPGDGIPLGPLGLLPLRPETHPADVFPPLRSSGSGEV